jgi:DNA helicase-2/ATP-dependent DNA helicase PcrA
MDPWADVRLRARKCHGEAYVRANGDRRATALVSAAIALRNLEVVPFVPGTRFGHGVQGCFERVGGLVSIATTLAPGIREIVIAHEIGHYELHDEPLSQVSVTEVPASGTSMSGSVIRIEGYSALERHEIAANAFASEFLLPADWLRTEILDRGQRPSQIAVALGLPQRFVMHQAIRAVLLPPLKAATLQASHRHDLDPTQRAAATWSSGNLLVEAGPGTGKTATLVGRVKHLLDAGTTPTAILVLTFSNHAADELRSRIADAAPEAAMSMWIGNFHSFGLEVLRKWQSRSARSANPTILDRDGALELLERHLRRLPLRAFRNVMNPLMALAPVLRAIERCKDEMVTPEAYDAAVRAASMDGDNEALEAAAEVAAVYRAYQKLLVKEDAVDLGDLVMMATMLLEEHSDVAQHYGDRFQHVLVDEYQDVNAASIRMLQSLAGPGTNLWVVGDERQSIYRFRGAEAGNTGKFEQLFGGETLALGVNYRSGAHVVAAVSEFSNAMKTGRATWTASRGLVGSVKVMAAPSLSGEAKAIREHIEALRQTGVTYGEQAILARTHLTLERIAQHLEADGVPLTYLGDLFARPEVKGLLALLAVDAEQGGIGLLRVAAAPPYNVSRRDIVLVIRHAVQSKKTIAELLTKPDQVLGLPSQSIAGLHLLANVLSVYGADANAWDVLTGWLFERTSGINALASSTDCRSRMQVAAIYQLIKLAADDGGGRRQLLDRVRRIAALGEGRDYGVLVPEADDAEGVRLMTVHGAKGLEFRAVHLPAVARHYVPLGRRSAECPPPPDLAHLALSAEDHDAEERALFFVALSRATDHLSISHARRYTPGREAGPSGYLTHIGPVETTQHDDVEARTQAPILIPQTPSGVYAERDLQIYMRCPARYRFEVVEGLRGVSAPSAYQRFRRAVAATLVRLQKVTNAKKAIPDEAEILSTMDGAWGEAGPLGAKLESYYRDLADGIVLQAGERLRAEDGARYHHEEWAVDVGPGLVSFRPDRIIEHPWDEIVVQAVRTGSRHVTDRLEGIHALMAEGAHERFSNHRIHVETLDATTGDVFTPDASMTDDALEPYRASIRNIERGDLSPRPDSRHCPNCPYLFACEPTTSDA